MNKQSANLTLDLLCVNLTFELQTWVMLETPSYWGWHLCHTVLKSIHPWKIYSPDNAKCHFDLWSLCMTLIFDLKIWFMNVKHCLIENNIGAKIFFLKSIHPLSKAKLQPDQVKGQFGLWLLCMTLTSELQILRVFLSHLFARWHQWWRKLKISFKICWQKCQNVCIYENLN